MGIQTKKLVKFFLVPLLFATVAVWVANSQLQPDFLLHVNFYDVGQGDSIFIQTYLGNQILIDGGPTDQVLSGLGEDMPFFDHTLDLVILSHPHTDHVSGLIEVLQRYHVKKVLLPDVVYQTAAYQELLEIIERERIEKIWAHAGQRIYLDSATVLDIYHPPAGHVETKEPNEYSIVSKLSFGQTKILLTGDAGFPTENLLLPAFDLDADVLKVGHQGSRFSTSEQFLAEVSPQYAVISVGENNYGHPTNEALGRILGAKAELFRTDQDSTVRFVSDGVKLYKE